MNINKLKGRIKLLHPLTFFANVLAFIVATFVAFMPIINEKNFGIVIALFFGVSFCIQTWLYYVKGLKESQWVDRKYLTSTKFMPKLLDQYALFNYKLWGVMKVTTVLWLFFTSTLSVLMFIFTFNVCAIFLKAILYNYKKLPVPKGFIRLNNVIYQPKVTTSPRLDVAYKAATGLDRMKYD